MLANHEQPPHSQNVVMLIAPQLLLMRRSSSRRSVLGAFSSDLKPNRFGAPRAPRAPVARLDQVSARRSLQMIRPEQFLSLVPTPRPRSPERSKRADSY